MQNSIFILKTILVNWRGCFFLYKIFSIEIIVIFASQTKENMTTITLNERTRAGRTLFDFAQTLAAKNKGITIDRNEVNKLNVKTQTIAPNEAVFFKKLKRAGQHAREIGSGIRKGNSIKSLMDEL